MESDLMTPEQLAARYVDKITVRTLANWRSSGNGPNYTKVGSRVFYRLTDVVEWEQHRTRKIYT